MQVLKRSALFGIALSVVGCLEGRPSENTQRSQDAKPHSKSADQEGPESINNPDAPKVGSAPEVDPYDSVADEKKAPEKQPGTSDTPTDSPKAEKGDQQGGNAELPDVKAAYPDTLERFCEQSPATKGTPLSYDNPSQSKASAWEGIQARRQLASWNYLCDHLEGFKAFTHNPVGFSGIPTIVFRLLPDVMPDIWGDEGLEKRTGFFINQDEKFPHGYSYIKDKEGPHFVVNLTCAGCHTGRVRGPDGKEQIIVGAPSTTIDVLGLRRKIFDSVNDPRFTLEKFNEVLATKKPGWLYGVPEMGVQEAIDTKVFEAKGSEIIAGIKASSTRGEQTVHGLLGSYTYRNAPELLNGENYGALEAFGFGSMIQIPSNFPTLEPEEKLQVMQDTLPPSPGIVDIMSVWRQVDRDAAQWDGNIRSPLIRNLGAEVGIIRDPSLVNYENGVVTTEFVSGLPSPVYPFKVDMAKASRGKKIYEMACASCHESNRFMRVEEVGTDPGRAKGLTEKARIGLIASLKAACIDKDNPDCLVDDDDVISPRQDNPGYTSQLLDGIWARAPYLHNGSVPTMEHLLIPNSRPAKFSRGNINYDQEKMGFMWQAGGLGVFDIEKPGFSNAGHANKDVFFGGIDFEKEVSKRQDLIEYLKTL